MTLEQRVEDMESDLVELKKQLSEITEALSCFQTQIIANLEQIIRERPVQ